MESWSWHGYTYHKQSSEDNQTQSSVSQGNVYVLNLCACVCVCVYVSMSLSTCLPIFLQVACKYITDPVLFHRDEIGLVKFDIRYVVLLVSAQPLTLYSYDTFWLRFANK